MAVDANDVVRCTVIGEIDGKEINNVYHCQLEGEGDLADSTFKAAVLTRLGDMYEEMNAETTLDLEYDRVEFFNVTQDKPMSFLATTSSWDGLVNTTRLPPAVAAVVNFGTNVARSQGRKFLAGMVGAGIDEDGVPDSALLAALAQFAVEALATWAVGQFTLQLGNYNYDIDRFAAWQAAFIPPELKTQRRRYTSRGS